MMPFLAPDGSLWFLMPVGDQDQLFRMAHGARRCRSATSRATSAASRSRPPETAVVVWADRDLRCADLNCAGLPQKLEDRIGPHLRSIVHSPLGYLGRRPASARGCSLSRLPAESSPAPAFRSTASSSATRRRKPFGGGEEIAFSPDGRTVYFALREAGRIEALSTNLDIFAAPSGRKRAAGQPHRGQPGDRHAADDFARRPDAGLCRDGAPRLRIRSSGADASRSRHRRRSAR